MQQVARDRQDPAELTGALPVIPAGDGRHRVGSGAAPGRLVAGPPRQPGRAAPARPRQRQIVIVAAHGGAGASTLVSLLTRELAGAPAGRGWRVAGTPALPDADPAQIAAADWLKLPPPEVPLIVAARGNAPGARRAVIAVTALGRRGIWPAAIALTADGAGPEPRQAAQHLDLIADRAGPVIRVPFAAALRGGGTPESVRLPAGLRAALSDLLALAAPAPARARQPW